MWADAGRWAKVALILDFILPALGDATESDFLRLYDKLLGNYTPHMRPLENQTSALTVTLQFDLISVSELNDAKQRVSALVLVSVQWYDKNLIWEPSEYGSIDRMYLNGNQIWAPKVYIQESATMDPKLFSLPTTHLALPTGNVTFASTGIIEAACRLNVVYFPYDYQSCSFVFGVLDSSRQDVLLEADSRGPQKSPSYVEDGEWQILAFETALKYSGIKDYETQTLKVTFTLQRRSTYYVLNVIVPAMSVSLLSLLTFAIPVDSGERLLFCLSILLSMSVYLTYIGCIMPSSSIEMPIILRYLVCLFLISSLCVIITVAVIIVRWSKVAVVNDQQKRIFILGIPITFRRRRSLFGVLHRCPKKTQQSGHSHNCNEILSVCSCQLQNFPESFSPNTSECPSSVEDLGNASSTFSRLHKSDLRRSVAEKMKCLRKSFKRNSKAKTKLSLEADIVGRDLDVTYICSRLDLGSFLVILFFYLVTTVHTFVQLNRGMHR
ncbi:unnamed protein product [Candidula unifasciata]|uniref:Uncharacterized protein n=1 Tax=Candidula unifasciata TaxID=100452 RepID=A0A8S3ZNX0_9EUPU|nr:unnamed protein product [Candidula unifasciata]